MADGYTMRIVFNHLPNAQALLADAADKLVRKTAADIEAEAKAGAPVRTGYLRNSVTTETVGPAHQRVSVGADYGPFVVYGTRFMAPRDFWNPAIEHQWDAFVSAWKTLETLLK